MVRDTNLISQELERIASYSSYPEGNTPSALTLARTGFVYSGREFKVSCPNCGIEVEKFRHDENPLDEHRNRSPDCPLAAHALDGASSSPSIDIISEDAVQSSPLMLDVYKSAMRRSDRKSQMVQSPLSPETSVQLSSIRVNREDPDYELLRWERCRLDTYHDWPVTANAVPEDLARDGLFYTGTEDRVRCAFCRNGLRSWQPGDVPREEHRRYFPNCPFVQNHDVGNVRIEHGCNSLPASSGQRAGPIDPLPSAPALPPQVTAGPNVSIDLFMTSATVRAIIEMGFSADVVKKIIQQQFSETGELFQNAEALLDKLLSLGIGISEVPSGVESHEELEPGSSASVAQQRQPEATTSCASSSEQATVVNSVEQENVVTKKHKTRKKKRGKASNNETTVNLGSSAASNPSGTASQANDITTSATAAAAAAGTSEAASLLEAERFGDVPLDAVEQELMEENDRLREARLCRVCMDKEINTVFLPCGHLICCDVCSPRIKNCPLCRTFIRGTVKAFLS